MNITETFTQIILEKNTYKTSKKSSLIQDWLGTANVPQSVSIRVGNYLETFFCRMILDKNKLDILTLKGHNNFINVDGEDHQVDLLAQIEDKVLITREIKCNLDLDRGKTRDTLRREEQIERGLEEQFDVSVDGGIFCPFYYGIVKKDSRFNMVFGLQWFIDTFECDFTVEDFQQMGRDPLVHKILCI